MNGLMDGLMDGRIEELMQVGCNGWIDVRVY